MERVTISETITQLRQEANARGVSTLLFWAADTLEAMHKALAEAEYQTECVKIMTKALNVARDA